MLIPNGFFFFNNKQKHTEKKLERSNLPLQFGSWYLKKRLLICLFSIRNKHCKICVFCVTITENMDWAKWRDEDISNLANRCVEYSQDSENKNKLRWLKLQIILKVIKCVIYECILEKCKVSSALIDRVATSFANTDAMSSSVTHENVQNTLHIISILQDFTKRFHEKSEEDEDWELLQSELRQIVMVPPSTRSDSFNNLHYVVLQQNALKIKRLRIYLCCPGCTKASTRTVSFPNTVEDESFTLQLVKADTPWLYWGDFQVSVSNSFCRIHSHNQNTAEKDIIAFANAVIIEEKSRFKSKNYTAVILDHLISEIVDEKSFCAAIAIVKDLKPFQLDSADIKAIFDKIAPKLDDLNSVTAQHAYRALFGCSVGKEVNNGKWLSAKQLFAIVNLIAKGQSSEKLLPAVIDPLLHNLISFDDTTHNGRNKAMCSALDKFMLIPCFNYLGFPDSLLKKQFPRFFESFLQTINEKIEQPLQINEKDFIQVLITDLKLRKNPEFFPKVRIENYLLDFLWRNGKHTNLTKEVTDVLLNSNHYDKKKTNPWTLLWGLGKMLACFPILLSNSIQ
ncbi:hypothetical protein RFI_25973 [Reticulomyxa filosa]|uniref:Uncharacterized protein n=1 Tax=Reticulomyxa filosa TaxID=46433 RepID=X6MBN6_RETFI|nr:hypothetical protein RFI_25973 [Reticulomyxa filosa]|eukprot:ETO11403.1 hypothetical protein RFI_25973 [Reticulomyxa filosa]